MEWVGQMSERIYQVQPRSRYLMYFLQGPLSELGDEVLRKDNIGQQRQTA